jgi:outer membrane protein OmpA-like peptidoglycan-associated protein
MVKSGCGNLMQVKNKLGQCVLIAILALSMDLHGALQLESKIFMAGLHESRWMFVGATYQCELRHEVPQFGKAIFSRIAGEQLQFHIDSFQPIPERIQATLREVSPAWEHNDPDDLEQILEVHTGTRPIQLGRKPAGWLLTSLSKGQVGSFDFLDWDDRRRKVSIRLSPVRFLAAYRTFKQCLSKLPKQGFESLKNSIVYFPVDGHVLDVKTKQQLDRLASYLQADQKVTRIVVAGHADDQGTRRYNMKLSAKRAASVSQYLISKGVNHHLIQSRHYGESRPAVPKQTQPARAANRRVHMILQR